MRHLIGLVLGTEDDWPTAFEALAARIGAFEWRGGALDGHRVHLVTRRPWRVVR